jgi:hypothetical protein
MVQKQKEAEFKREETLEMKEMVLEKQKIANEKQENVERELGQIRPMLEAAEQSVKNINK